ncbi:2-oxoglutarate (2OG) and Fe(II)-dependent oxygenase superfamily protein [Rhynchospora pubera]|uniref:2-oxoglutarate (2OG) and Fe(II)-dependent oxygenase superfamily protein n=1 Tax=Rhynchospora pubera TaxID=906938 RepID=A0AAV8EHQ8_9POAL|nr:2-oxoglutarate (2OG) and Fe(II)-dependent oxygenase superfamily protein [Rhynchospora pubera]
MELVGSLPVPNVQALSASSNGRHVPPRYVRPDVSADPVSSNGGDAIPVIYFSRLMDPQFSLTESQLLAQACEEWGFFQLIDHSVSTELIERMKSDIEGFFKLPLETKREFAQRPGQFEGYGQLFVVSEEQKLDWADVLYLNTLPIESRDLRFWPDLPPGFRDTLHKYSLELNQIVHSLLAIIAKNLGLKPEAITEKCKDGVQSVRINYYPPCLQHNEVIGFSPHSDGDLLTMVLQVNDVQGLQIKKNGIWVPVTPLEGAFVVNLGDCFQIFTNGKYKSIEHRAVINPEKERLSIAAFHSPSLHALIGPLTELVESGDEIYKTVDHENYMRLFFSSKLEGKKFLDQMRLHSS